MTQILLVLPVLFCELSISTGFFFKMPTTAAPTTLDPYALKPIIIHHHHKWKYVHPTTTEAPWTWAPQPDLHPWHHPKWSIKPVEEIHHEAPPTEWKPYHWQWPSTTTTTETPWALPSTELPPKWAYQRQSNIDEDTQDTQPKPSGISTKITKTTKKQNAPLKIVVDDQQALKTTSVISPRILINEDQSIKLKTKTHLTVRPVVQKVNNVQHKRTITPTTNEQDEEVKIEETPSLIDEQSIKTIEQPIEELTEPKTNTVLYKYIYKVHSPVTKDIKMHQEESDGQNVVGHYALVEPDGSTRVVYYTAGDYGFNADVKNFDWSRKMETTEIKN